VDDRHDSGRGEFREQETSMTNTETSPALLDSGEAPARKTGAFVVLVNWNGWQDTIECLTSLQTLDYEDWKALVIDNGSTDDSLQRIRTKFPRVEIIELGRNLGFAAGCNAGIRLALGRGAEYIWLLNNDTLVDPKALRAMVDRAEADPKIGAVGSVIYFMEEPQRLQAWGGGYVSFWLGGSRRFVNPVNDEKLQYITGTSLLLRRSALEMVGLLDEGFFMYWEDTDYCFRLRGSGWSLAVAEKSKLWHKESASVTNRSARKDTLSFRSAVRFFERYSPVPFVSVWVGMGLRLGQRAVRGDWKMVRAIWEGFRQAEIAPLTVQNSDCTDGPGGCFRRRLPKTDL
jgi:GT2 family glycosyltransferase